MIQPTIMLPCNLKPGVFRCLCCGRLKPPDLEAKSLKEVCLLCERPHTCYRDEELPRLTASTT